MIIDQLRSVRRWAPAVLLLAFLGCGEPGVTSDTIRKPIPIGEVPEPVLAAAKKALPGVTFDDAWKNMEKGVTLQSYEVRGRASNGKIREVRVSTTGEVLEME